MSWWQAIILGIVQGLTEFIPVSSSGHLILSREVMGVVLEDFVWFDLLLHVATLAAIVIIMRKDILALFKKPFKVAFFIVIASIPLVIVGFFLGGIIRQTFYYDASFLWIFFLITAILLLASEMYEKKLTPKAFILETGWEIKNFWQSKLNKKNAAIEKKLTVEASVDCPNNIKNNDVGNDKILSKNAALQLDEPLSNEYLPDLKLKHAIAMGCMQMIAVFPGVSRSGSTIFGGVITNGKRKTIAKFSFLMSIPVIIGATLLDLYQGLTAEAVAETVTEGALALTIPWYGYVLGIVFAFAVGVFAIKFMLKLIAKANFKWFSLYMFTLSIICFFVFFL